MTWLLRLVDDPCPTIRQVVAEALAARDDPRKIAALRRLTDPADIEVSGTVTARSERQAWSDV